MTWMSFLWLVLAGVASGLAGSIGGLASLFSYPALLAAGLPAISANMTNTVSLALSSLSSITSSRPELVGQAPVVRRFGVICGFGGAVGAALVLVTPSTVFAALVPFLVGGASVALLLRRDTVRAAEATVRHSRGPLTLLGVFAIAVYGGYFGAAAGVLLLALLLTVLPETLIRVNALKNVLLGLSNMIASVGFTLFGVVSWTTALPLTVGLLAGNWIGPSVARRLPSNLMRVGIAVAGLGLSIKLGWDAFAVPGSTDAAG